SKPRSMKSSVASPEIRCRVSRFLRSRSVSPSPCSPADSVSAEDFASATFSSFHLPLPGTSPPGKNCSRDKFLVTTLLLHGTRRRRSSGGGRPGGADARLRTGTGGCLGHRPGAADRGGHHDQGGGHQLPQRGGLLPARPAARPGGGAARQH